MVNIKNFLYVSNAYGLLYCLHQYRSWIRYIFFRYRSKKHSPRTDFDDYRIEFAKQYTITNKNENYADTSKPLNLIDTRLKQIKFNYFNSALGFSLIEVLIALSIASIIGIALFSSLDQMTRISNKVDTIIEDDDRMALLHNQLKKDLSGAFVPTQAVEQPIDKDKKNKKPLEKVFYSSNSEKNTLNTLTFITTNPLTSYGSSKPRIARVVYKMVPQKENGQQPSYTLLRQQGPDLEYDTYKQDNKKNRSYAVAEQIKNLTIEYTTTKKSVQKNDSKNPPELETVKEWDSDKNAPKEKAQEETKKKENAATQKNQQSPQNPEKKEKEERIWLPLYATITITLWDARKKHEYTTQLIVPIVGSSFTEPVQEAQKPAQKKQGEQKKDPTPEKGTPPPAKAATPTQGVKVVVAQTPKSKNVFEIIFDKSGPAPAGVKV